MTAPVQLEMRDGLAVFQPVAEVELDVAAALVTEAIAAARGQGHEKLLILGTGLTGFESPGLGSRYFFVHDWAKAAEGLVRVALVLRPELLDREKFGILVALNAGFACDAFTSEPEALEWLRRFK